jgi:hypothetical protein
MGLSMADLPLLKLVEVLGVGLAGGLFVWWQLRDVKRAQEASRRERLAREARAAQHVPDPQQAPVPPSAGNAQAAERPSDSPPR